MAFTWDEIQGALVWHKFHQVDEVVLTAITKANGPDLFDFKELQLALSGARQSARPQSNQPGNSSKRAFATIPSMAAFMYNQHIRFDEGIRRFGGVGSVWLPYTFRRREETRMIRLPTVRFVTFLQLGRSWMDKMCASRLGNWREKNNVFYRKQYSFHPNRSTIDEYHDVLRSISESKRVDNFTCISLDIKHTLNSARRTNLLRHLPECDVPSDLLGFFDSFLHNTSIISNANQHYFNVGVP